MKWVFRGREHLFERPWLMAVLNVTPDSFSDGGKFMLLEEAVRQAEALIRSGADALDIGGESTRSGASAVSETEEIDRVLPLVKKIRSFSEIPISIDTTKPGVAAVCLEAGADIVNDVSGLQASGDAMAEVINRFQAGIVLMHRRGNPQTMQSLTNYRDVAAEVFEELRQSLRKALDAGIGREQIAVDPGLGFAKTTEQNFEILKKLELFHDFERPLFVGPSRKSFIGQMTGKESHDRDFGTAAIAALCIMRGVHVIRVHNIEAIKDVINVLQPIYGEHYVRTFKMGKY